MTLFSEPRPLDHSDDLNRRDDPEFLVESYRRPGCTSIDIIGAVTIRSMARLHSIIRSEAARLSPGAHLRVDLLRCSGLTTAAIRSLRDEQQYCEENDVVFYLARVPDPLVTKVEQEHSSSLLQPPWI